MERRRVLHLGTKGGGEDRGKGVEEKVGEGGKGDVVGLSSKGGMRRGKKQKEENDCGTERLAHGISRL